MGSYAPISKVPDLAILLANRMDLGKDPDGNDQGVAGAIVV